MNGWVHVATEIETSSNFLRVEVRIRYSYQVKQVSEFCGFMLLKTELQGDNSICIRRNVHG